MGATAARLTSHELERWAHVGVLAALALVLGYLETFVPIPIPGVKLGLANIAILVAIVDVGPAGAFFVMATKVIAAGLLFGNPLMIIYSATGSVLAFVGMVAASRLKTMHVAMTSVIGGMLHEVGQLLVASVLLGTPLVWYGAPILLVAGCVTGAICGMVSAWTISALAGAGSGQARARGEKDLLDGGASPSGENDRGARGDAVPGERGMPQTSAFGVREGVEPPRHVGALLLALVVFAVVVLHLSATVPLLVALAVSVVACVASRVRPRLLGKALMPMLFFVLVVFVTQTLSVRSGEVLLRAGPLVVTTGSLVQTGRMLLRLLAVVLANVAFMARVPVSDLSATFERMMAPFARLGLKTEGPVVAFGMAMRFVPILADRIIACFAQRDSRVLSKAFWREEVPEIIVGAYGLAADASAHAGPDGTASQGEGES